MSLLGELWAGGSSMESTEKAKRTEGTEKAGKFQASSGSAAYCASKKGLTYSEALSSSSEERGCRQEMQGDVQRVLHVHPGAKRPRLPSDNTCGRCFRMTHKTADCRHQVVCLRCSGVSHVAANCRVDLHWSPWRKRVHVRSKNASKGPELHRPEAQNVPARSHPVTSDG